MLAESNTAVCSCLVFMLVGVPREVKAQDAAPVTFRGTTREVLIDLITSSMRKGFPA